MTHPDTILVTGGAGFIGSHLVERLLAEGHRVRVIDDLSTGRLENLRGCERDPRLEVRVSAVSRCPVLEQWMAEAGGVFHLAAAVGVELVVRHPIQTITTNLQETEALLEAARGRSAPILIASTSEVYGKSPNHAFAEQDDLLIGPPHLARWSYACSKLMDEFLAMAYQRERGLPVIIARLFNTVGPRQTGCYGMVLPRFIEAARQNQPLRVYGDGSQTRCFCHVSDTVEALLRILRCKEAIGEVINVGHDEEVTIEELACRVIRLLGSTSKVEHVPYEQAYAPGFEDMLKRRPVIDKCLRLTGFRPGIALDEIILSTAGLSTPASSNAGR
jgi:UDP-glucose 4-epimerase